MVRRARTDTDSMQAWIRRYLAHFEDFEATCAALLDRYGRDAVRRDLREHARECRELNEERYERLRRWFEASQSPPKRPR